MGEVSEEEIVRAVRSYRRERRAPEITVAGEKRVEPFDDSTRQDGA